MGKLATLAEMFAAKSGKATQEVEEALAHQINEAKLSKQAGDYVKGARNQEYQMAEKQASTMGGSPQSTDFQLVGEPQTKDFQLVGEPTGGNMSTPEMASKWNQIPTPEGGHRVPEGMGMVPTPAVNMNAVATGISGAPGISADDFNKFNAGKAAEDRFNALKNPKALAGMAAAGAGTYSLMNGSLPPGPTSAVAGEGPKPASVKPEEPTKESPDEKEYKSSFKNMFATVNSPSKEPFDMSALTGTSLGSDEEMRKAMATRDRDRIYNDIAKSAQLIGSGMSGTDYSKTGGKALEDQAKLIDQPVTDLEKRVENQENDPKSTASVAMRGMALKMGFKFNENISAADIKKQIPQMTSLQTHADAAEALKMRQAERMQDRMDSRKDKKDSKDNDYLFNASKSAKSLVDNYTKTKLAGDSVRSATGKNPAEQITTLYNLVSTLDPASTVREGEVSLAQGMTSLMGRVETAFQKVKAGQIVDTQTLEHMKQEILRLEKNQEASYRSRMGIYEKQLRARGMGAESMEMIDPYYKASTTHTQSPGGNEIARKDKNGRVGIFDANTKEFIRWK